MYSKRQCEAILQPLRRIHNKMWRKAQTSGTCRKRKAAGPQRTQARKSAHYTHTRQTEEGLKSGSTTRSKSPFGLVPEEGVEPSRGVILGRF